MKPFNLEEYLANPSKKLVTREGRDARIICTDRKADCFAKPFSIVALVLEDGVTENIYAYTEEGRRNAGIRDDLNDLFFAPEKKEGWINIWGCNDGTKGVDVNVYDSYEDAFNNRKTYDYVATIKIEWKE